MNDNKVATFHKIKSFLVKNKDKISIHTQKVGLFKFIFGIDIGYTKFLLFLGFFFLIIHCLFLVLTEIFFGLCLNFIKSGNMSDLKFLCLIIAIIGPLQFLLMFGAGFLFKKHSHTLSETYKRNYYSLVFKQEFLWFNKQDLNKFSESIKKDNLNIEKGVNLFLIMELFFYFFQK